DGPALADLVEGDLGTDLEPIRRRPAAAEARRERHRETRGVRRGEKLLGARLSARLGGACRPRDGYVIQLSARDTADRPRSAHEIAAPHRAGFPRRRHIAPPDLHK